MNYKNNIAVNTNSSIDDMENKNDKDAISVSATIPIKPSYNSIYETLKNKIQQLFNKEGKYRISLNYDKMIQQYDYMLDTADRINSLTPDQLLQLQEQIIKLENAKRMKELEEGLNKMISNDIELSRILKRKDLV